VKPWVDLAKPHDDILSGDLEMAVFAADLGSVSRDGGRDARRVYSDAVEFFRATYLTSSMRTLLTDVLGALAGRGGDRVLQLRTPFGGGKTHTLLALYHLATARSALAGLPEVAALPDPGPCRVATLSGLDLDPAAPRDRDGTRLRTLWGELAWQVGGAEAYRLVAEQDERGTAPGGEVLGRLLDQGDATLVLLDEALVYAEKAKAMPLADSSLGAQVLVFLHTLTEVVARTPRTAMVYSLQASVLEAAGDEELLMALDHLVSRVDAKREPVTGDEVMRVVQRRLFADLGPDADRQQVAREQAERYARYRAQIAETESERREAQEEATRFADRVLKSYPFHPALLDLMHQRWTTLPSYQRTRGALQFLATVVHALWHGEQEPLALIGPGDVPFEDEKVRGAFFAQVGDREGFTGVLERDFIGTNAGVRTVDQRLAADSRRLGKLRVGTRVSSAILLYSFGGRVDQDRGVLEGELVGALLDEELERNLLVTAVADLRDELLFLHSTGRRYRFDKTPNLNQLLANEANRFTPEEVEARIRREMERQLGATRDGLLWPEDGASIPDDEPVFRVVYLPAELGSKDEPERLRRVRDLYEFRGPGATRAYRNALAFALPDREAFEYSRSASRRGLAAESLVGSRTTVNIEGEQLDELRRRLSAANNDLAATVERAYVRVLLPARSKDGDAPYAFEDVDLRARLGLGRLLHQRVLDGISQHVFETVTPEKLAGLLNLGDGDGRRRFVACSSVVDSAFSYLDFPRLRDDSAIRKSISDGIGRGTFGYIADADARENELDANSELVRIRVPAAQDEVDLGARAFLLAPGYAAELVPRSEPKHLEEQDQETTETGGGEAPPPPPPPPESHRLRIKYQADKGSAFTALTMLPAIAERSSSLAISVDIDATAEESFDATWVRNAVHEPLDEAGIDAHITLE
jgi:hypothetical protein